jgi:hypothetical protein
MNCSRIRLPQASLRALAISPFLVTGFTVPVHATDNRAPSVPSDIVVPEGNKVHFHEKQLLHAIE